MNEFTFTVPQEIVVGAGSISRLGELLKKSRCSRPMVISGKVLTKMGAVDNVMNIVKEAGYPVTLFNDVEANPSIETVERATEEYKRCGADCIIAFGGGSPMDVAKAVGVVAIYGGDIKEYEGGGKVPGKIVPIIAIPTTAGTGSEVTAFTVITDHSRNYKLTVFSYDLIPKFALLDPDLITSLPKSVAAATSIDALVHAIEAYLSKAASPFSDAMAEKAMELIGKGIRTFVQERTNQAAATDMLTGSMFAGLAFAWARLGNIHAMAHPLSGFFDIPHGVANAILLPTVMEYNAVTDKGRYQKIYEYLVPEAKGNKEFSPEQLVAELKNLIALFEIPGNLCDVGVTEDKIEAMAADAMKSGNILLNPRETKIEDIIALYKKAMK